MVIDPILKPVVQSVAFPELLEQLSAYWEDEQNRRLEFYNWVTPNMKAEFIEGEIVVHSPVQLKHNKVCKRLLLFLELHIERNDLGFVGVEKIMIRLTRNDYEPDICFFSKDKSDAFDPSQTLFPAPDFVVEITSPSTESRDRGLKMEDYARHGITEYWIIDPDTEVVEQYLLADGTYQLHLSTRTAVLQSTAVAGFSISARAIFDDAAYREAMQG